MNTESFQIFIDVYNNESFAEVAKSRNIAPSSITRSIAQLEQELGFRLFQRTTRKVSPTEEGEEFYKRILPINEELGKIKDQISDKMTNATLRVTANVSFSYSFLNNLIPKFKKKYPNINLELIITDEYVDLVSERVDLAIRYGKLVDSSLVGTKLFELDYVLCASAAYLKNKKIKRPEDIRELDCIGLMISRYNLTWKFKKREEITDVVLRPHIKAKGTIPLVEYAKAGLGLTVVPRRMVDRDLKSGKLVSLFEDYEITPTEFGAAAWMLYPSSEFVPTKVKVFAEFLKAQLARS